MVELCITTTRVLCIGNDSTLLRTRDMILTRAGYRVCSFADWSVTEDVELSAFDVIVFCHSVPLERAEWISRLARSRSRYVLTVQLTRLDCGEVSGFDTTFDVNAGPSGLLLALAEVCRLKSAAA